MANFASAMPQTSWSYCSRDSQLTINISALSQPSVGQVSRSYMDDTYPTIPGKQRYYQKIRKSISKSSISDQICVDLETNCTSGPL